MDDTFAFVANEEDKASEVDAGLVDDVEEDALAKSGDPSDIDAGLDEDTFLLSNTVDLSNLSDLVNSADLGNSAEFKDVVVGVV